MSRAIQLLLIGISLIGAVFVGGMLGYHFDQIHFRAEDMVERGFLPPTTEFLMHHSYLPLYAMVTVWLVFVALPTVTKQEDYFDVDSFTLRYLLFATVEAALLVAGVHFATLPFIPHWLGIVPEYEHTKTLRAVAGLAFWALVVAVALLIMRRIHRSNANIRPNKTLQHNP